jgi:uncharacterized protein YdaU (DUF1376 family)
MNFYPFHIGDYISHTHHLSNEEDLAYRRLIDLYYMNEEPFIHDLDMLARRVKSTPSIVDLILNEFFELIDGTWHNTRANKEIAKYRFMSESGKKGAEKRWSNREAITPPNATPIATKNQEPLTKNHNKNIGTPSGVAESVWNDYLKVRKAAKKPMTETALKGLVREADKAKLSLEQALTICIERSWVGFNAEWVNKATAPTARKEDKQWMFSDSGIEGKAKELGITPYGHDSYASLKERCIKVITERSIR